MSHFTSEIRAALEELRNATSRKEIVAAQNQALALSRAVAVTISDRKDRQKFVEKLDGDIDAARRDAQRRMGA